jgi:uridylate kinase
MGKLLSERARKALILKLGGSTAVNLAGLNLSYAARLIKDIEQPIFKQYERVVFVVGGGTRARQALIDGGVTAAIQVTQEHAAQLASVVIQAGLTCWDKVPTSVEKLEEAISETDFAVSVGGLEIGQTTDAVGMTATEILDRQGYQVSVVILSNVEAIYTADPRKFSSAKPVKKAPIDWFIQEGILLDNPQAFRDGMSVPLDPVAVSRYKALTKHKLLFTSADDVNGVRHFLTGVGEQSGTVICEGVDPCFYS